MEEPSASSPSPPSSVRTVRRSTSLSSERGRATELRSSPKARFGSDDSGASDADSNPRGERNWRPASPSGTVTDEETPRSEEEPVRRPRPSRASSLKGAASMSLRVRGRRCFVHGARARRRNSNARRRDATTRRSILRASVGSAAEMNALVERSTSVSAFDGWLAAADVAGPQRGVGHDEKTPTARSLGGKPSNGGAGTASASTVHRRSESQVKKQVRSDAERDDVPSDRLRPSADGEETTPRRIETGPARRVRRGRFRWVPTRVPTRVPPGNARDACDSFREYGNAHHELERRTRELWSLASAGAAMRARATTAAAAISPRASLALLARTRRPGGGDGDGGDARRRRFRRRALRPGRRGRRDSDRSRGAGEPRRGGTSPGFGGWIVPARNRTPRRRRRSTRRVRRKPPR